MSNPFHKTSRIKHLLSVLLFAAFSLSFAPVASAQDFDFADDEENAGGNDFDFADDTPAPLDLGEHFVMPDNGKPVNLVFFEPVDNTPDKTLEALTEATVDALKDDKYAEYDSVKAIPILQKLGEMDSEARFLCADDAACLADIGAEIGAANIIVGRIYTEGRERPQITFDLIDVKQKVKVRDIDFETQTRLRKQEQDISGALVRLFNIDTGSLDSLLGQRVVEESAPLPTAQLVSGIIVGAVALGAIGTGIYLGLEANNYNDKVKDAIKANEAITQSMINDDQNGGEAKTYTTLESANQTQRQAKKNLDKAKDYAMLANILYASGAVAAVVSVILFLVRPEENEDIFATKSNDLYIAPSIGNGNGGVVAGFTF